MDRLTDRARNDLKVSKSRKTPTQQQNTFKFVGHSKTPSVIPFVARNSLINYVYVSLTHIYIYVTHGRPQMQNILLLQGNLALPSTQAENINVCIKMAPCIFTI